MDILCKDNMTIPEKIGSLTSLIIGGPIGIVVILFSILLPSGITGEGLFLLVFAPMFVIPISSLIISFLIILWIGGRYSAKRIIEKQKLIWVSIKYTLLINAVIWSVFMISYALSNWNQYEWFFGFLLPFLFFLTCIITTPFTLELIICYLIKRKISMHSNV